ncbi:MAG: thermonuclease family protein [Gammaproteobacteria bacterium]|nr:thermonuclease family protein [Gammaproteobacteria bacterium]
MPKNILIKLIALSSLLLLPLSASAETPMEKTLCNQQNIDLWAHATYAKNGNTLIIQGKTVRLIGVHAPLTDRKQKFNNPGEPLSKEAQTFLNKLLANNDLEVGVEYDTTKVDKFGRQLVHLFLRDGTNIQEAIIKAGFGLNYPAGDNNKYAQCYFAAEKVAREGQFQLWDYLEKHPDSHFPLAQSSQLTSQDTGFRIIRGKVEKVMKSSSNYIINMDTTGIRIPKRHWHRFNYRELKALKGKTIEVRGQAFLHKGVMFMIIDTPNSIDALNPLNNPTKKR